MTDVDYMVCLLMKRFEEMPLPHRNWYNNNNTTTIVLQTEFNYSYDD